MSELSKVEAKIALFDYLENQRGTEGRLSRRIKGKRTIESKGMMSELSKVEVKVALFDYLENQRGTVKADYPSLSKVSVKVK